ncbi:WSC domain-containing protein [Colletotrichum cuscutae]|uniref:WSC domain-containing protein n=1 Tax=Colletotrichum cuscutae TaxID=1209917 RepID=A0AAI9U1X1_9PEZI|nr:WSC domain-containing protein [Colletotrichum cuscutae]
MQRRQLRSLRRQRQTLVFTNSVAVPVINPGPLGWSSLGCQNDPGPRLLSYRTGAVAGDSKMSVLQCTNACQAAGYSLAGSSGFDGCNMLCSGNSSEYCGGPNHINVYQASTKPKTPSVLPSGWIDKGCLKDNVLGRALTVNVDVVGGTQNMSVGGYQKRRCGGIGWLRYALQGQHGRILWRKQPPQHLCFGLFDFAGWLDVLFHLINNLDKHYFIICLNHLELLYNFKVYDKPHCIIYLVLCLVNTFIHLDFFFEPFNDFKVFDKLHIIFNCFIHPI